MISLAVTATSTMSPDQMIQNLQDVIQIAKGLPPTLGAILIVFVSIAMALMIIANYFWAKKKREDEAYSESKRLELEHNTNAQRIASDYITARLGLLDQAYQSDYKLYISRITEKNYPSVLSKISPTFHDELSKFIYDESLSPEARAQRIIYIVAKK